MECFTNLGSIISSDATVSKDLDKHPFKVSSSFEKTSKRVWQSHSLHLSTKVQVYRAIVVPTLLYGTETRVLYQKQARLFKQFHQRCLHSILVSDGETTCQMNKPSR